MRTILPKGSVIGHPGVLYRLLSDVEVETVAAERHENDELKLVDDAVAKGAEIVHSATDIKVK